MTTSSIKRYRLFHRDVRLCIFDAVERSNRVGCDFFDLARRVDLDLRDEIYVTGDDVDGDDTVDRVDVISKRSGVSGVCFNHDIGENHLNPTLCHRTVIFTDDNLFDLAKDIEVGDRDDPIADFERGIHIGKAETIVFLSKREHA